MGDIIFEIVKVVSSIFEPWFMELCVCIMSIKHVLSLGSLQALSNHIGKIPSLSSQKGKVKNFLTCTGGNEANVHKFMSHRSLYVLAGLQSSSDELQAQLASKAALKDGDEARKAALTLSKGVALLRQMVAQLSQADVEFAEENPWAELVNDEQKTMYLKNMVSCSFK